MVVVSVVVDVSGVEVGETVTAEVKTCVVLLVEASWLPHPAAAVNVPSNKTPIIIVPIHCLMLPQLLFRGFVIAFNVIF
jgi:hypothetical protein